MVASLLLSGRFSTTCRLTVRLGTTISRRLGSSAGRIRVAVVGSGRMGQIRASLLCANPRFDLAGIVDTNGDCARRLGEKHGVNFYDSLEAATAENDLDGLVISTPTFTHESVIRHAGVHQTSVFTEKPVDETADKIEALFEYAHGAGIDLCCGFQRRFDPSYVAATAAVQEGQVGTPIMASLFFADHPSPPKDFLLNGGNIFMDLAAHDVDYITHTLQDEVVSVYASGTSSDKDLTAADVQDNATMMMNFQQGAVVTLFMSRSATYGYDQRCEIFGPRGLVSVGNIHANTAVISNANGIRHSRWQYSFPERFAAAFALEMDAWADVLEKGWTWPVTAAQCVRVQRIVDAARLSAAQGSVVTVEAYNESRLD